MAGRRICAGYYRRYDGKVVYVVSLATDSDTGEETVIWTTYPFAETPLAISFPRLWAFTVKEAFMAISKSAKIEAEIEKVKAKITEQQARLKELEQKKVEAENSEIVDIVRGMSI